MSSITLSVDEARAMAVNAQGVGVRSESHASTMLERLGCVQIDAIRAVRRSHELAFLSRGVDAGDGFGPADVSGFETWGHAHSVIALRYWPLLAARRRHIRAKGLSGPPVDPVVCDRVLAAIADRGPLTLGELDRAQGSGWERSSPSKAACEWLLSVGDLVVSDRNDKWQRVYAWPELTIPTALLEAELTDEQCNRGLVEVSLRALGVATIQHVADYFRMPVEVVQRVLDDLDAETVKVDGSHQSWYLDRDASTQPPSTEGLIPLSPLDSLVWTRDRQRVLFGKSYLLESYKPPSKREFGYFGMPILCGAEMVGRVAARKAEGVLVVEAVQTNAPLDRAQFERLFARLQCWAACDTFSTATTKWIIDDIS